MVLLLPQEKSVTKTYCLTTLCCIGLSVLSATASADEVRFDGQNVMRGELKHLDRGQLYFKTPGTDTISIEWAHVDRVSSSKTFEIEFDNGDIMLGVVEPTESPSQLSIRNYAGARLAALSSVVRLTEIDEKVRDRFDGTASAGLNLTQQNSYESYNLGLDLTYNTLKYVSSLDLSSNINRSDDTATSEQSSLQIKSSRIWKKRRYTGGLLSFSRNQDLGIDLRSSLGITVGKTLRHTNSQIFNVEGGLLFTKEEIAGSSDSENSREAYLGAHYEWFTFDEPNIDLTTELVVIPSLTQSGRVRGSFNLTLKWEIVNDLYWRISYQQNADSDPPGESSANSDYNLFTGLAYDL
ncbi:conserved hypothetical protein [gamma proteobacterium NOR5-3]|nr:conserved hypothetical protein [gamma proteobacterium NOR5-3]